MAARQALAFLGFGAVAWGVLRNLGYLPSRQPAQPGQTAKNPAIASNLATYAQRTKQRESGGDPLADNPRSSASGLYQFTRATWLALGGQWGADPSKPFGGRPVTVAEQEARFLELTRRNAATLAAAGLAATAGNLYAAHFLGAGLAAKVLRAPGSTKLAGLVGSAVMRANPHLAGFTVADFSRWAHAKA